MIVIRALALAALACVAGRAPASAQQRRAPTVRDLIGAPAIVDVQLAPDGRRVLYEVRRTRWASNDYLTELWLVSTDRRTKPVRLLAGSPTTSAFQSLTARWSPDSRRIAYFSDRDGSNQVWLLNPESRATEPLTRVARWQAVDPRGVQPAFFRWSPDSRSIAFAASWPIPPDSSRDFSKAIGGQSVGVDWTKTNPYPGARTATNATAWLVDVGSRRVRRLTGDSLHIADLAWSPDGSRIVFSAAGRPEDVPYKTELYRLDVASGAASLLVAQPGWDAVPLWSPDGRWIAFESQKGNADWNYGSYLAAIPAEGGSPAYLAPGFDREVGSWPHLLAWTADSRGLYFSAYSRLG